DAVDPASVEHTAVLVFARYRGQSDPAGAPAIHGRARERNDRGGPRFTRLIRVPAAGRNPTHPAGRPGDSRSRLISATRRRHRYESDARPIRVLVVSARTIEVGRVGR